MCDVRLRDIRDVWRARDLGFHSVVAGALPLMDPNLRTEEPELHGNPKLSPETNPGPNLAFSPDPSPDPSPSPSFNLDQVRCCSRPVRARAWNLPCSSRRGSATLTPVPCCILRHAASLTMLHPLPTPLSLIMLHPLTMLQPPPWHIYSSCCIIQAMLAKGSVEFGGGAGKAACSKCLWPLAAHAATHRCRGPPACSVSALPSRPERSALALRVPERAAAAALWCPAKSTWLISPAFPPPGKVVSGGGSAYGPSVPKSMPTFKPINKI